MYGDIPIATSDQNAGGGYVGSSSAVTSALLMFDINTGVISDGNAFGITSDASAYSATAAIGTGTNIWGIFWQSSSAAYFNINYGAYSEVTADIPTTAVPIGFANTQGSQATLGPFYWLRTRAYPPNGVMPSVTFGAVQSATIPTLSISPLWLLRCLS